MRARAPASRRRHHPPARRYAAPPRTLSAPRPATSHLTVTLARIPPRIAPGTSYARVKQVARAGKKRADYVDHAYRLALNLLLAHVTCRMVARQSPIHTESHGEGAMTSDQLSVVDQVLTHLCHKGLYGDVVEWCEMRNDCVYVVTCPECRTSFTLLDEEY